MADFLKSNIGFDRRLKQKFHFVDYSPTELSHIFTSKLLKQKMRFPYGMEPDIAADDIKIGIKSFLQQYSRKRGEKLTKATFYQVMLHIKDVGIVPGSPI